MVKHEIFVVKQLAVVNVGLGIQEIENVIVLGQRLDLER